MKCSTTRHFEQFMMSVSRVKVKPYEETVLKKHISVSFPIGKYAKTNASHDNVSYRACLFSKNQHEIFFKWYLLFFNKLKSGL